MSEMDSQECVNDEGDTKAPGVPGPSGTNSREPQTNNPLKMRIDPLQLLNCLSILLNSKGAIKSIDEVQRVAGLMGKYSKKLVSKCIYLNILQATEEPLLDEFYKETGWNLVFSWLTEAAATKNFPLAQQILSLLLVSPISIERLKRNNMPKMVKDLSRECPHAGARNTAEKVVECWKEMVKGCIGSNMSHYLSSNEYLQEEGATRLDVKSPPVSGVPPLPAGVESGVAAAISGTPTPTPIPNTPGLSNGNDATPVATASRDAEPSSSSASGVPEGGGRMDDKAASGAAPGVTTAKRGRGRGSAGRGSAGRGSTRGVGRGRGRRKRGAAGGGRGRGRTPPLSYAELLRQDISSSDDLGKEEGEGPSSSDDDRRNTAPGGEGSVPPIRIAIRNGVKLVAPAGTGVRGGKVEGGKQRQRPSVDSTDSDDNKPLSKIRDECQKGTSSEEEKEEEKEKEAGEGDTEKEAKKEEEDDDDDDEVKMRKRSKKRIIDDEDDEDVTPATKKSVVEEEEKKKKEKGKRKEEEKHVKGKEDSKNKGKEGRDSSEDERRKHKTKEHKDGSKGAGKERDKDKDNKGKNREKDRSRHRSSSKDNDRHHRDKHHDRDKKSSKDKDKDKDKDKGRKGSIGDAHHEEKDRRKEQQQQQQAEADRATLDKIKPLSTEGLAKIPRKASASSGVSFLDALGSADSDVSVSEGKRSSTVVKSKSRGFRNTGLLDEIIKPAGIAGKRSSEVGKKPSLTIPTAGAGDSKTTKVSPSSLPHTGDRPGGIKLISPKRHQLSDDGGFMAALKAAGADRKKIVRKRKSSDCEGKPDVASHKALKTEGSKDSADEGAKIEDEHGTLHRSSSEEESGKGAKTEDKSDVSEPALLSPTSIKPTLNFYKETLPDESEKKEASDGGDGKDVSEESSSSGGSKSEGGESPPSGDSKETSPTRDPKKDDDSMDIDDADEDNGKETAIHIGGDGDGERESGDAAPFGSDEEVLDERRGSEGDIPVPAPAQEEYERIEVTFSLPKDDLKGVLVYHRPATKRKKSVKWKAEEDLKETFFFPMDETERVNVNTIRFKEMMMMEKAKEKELMCGKNRNRYLSDGVEIGMPNTCIDYGPYKLYPVHLPIPSKVVPGCKSMEKHIQAQREHATMATFFHPVMKPDTPTEPDPEMVQRAEPVVIPLNDVSGSDTVTDNRRMPWPEPLYGQPEFPYMGGPAPHQAPPQQTGGHWVLGNHSVPRFNNPPPPMYVGPNVPPPAGPVPAGNQGPFGPPPQPFPGDMHGGWGVPNEFGGPPVMMPNGPPPMGMPGMGGPNPGMQGGPPMQGGPGHGPRPGLGPGMGHMGGGGGGGGVGGGGGHPMGNRDNYPRYRRGGGGGGKWGGSQSGRPHCIHFKHGNCRHGDDCKYVHVPS